MVTKIKFGSKQDANEQRDKFEQFLSEKDDRRKKTVKLSDDAPDRVREKARSAGFESEEADTHNAGMRELSENEREQLNRVHRGFEWQENGFEAMRVKGALQAKGVTDWQNYYEPGEGVSGAVKTLETSKASSARSGASVAMDDRRDPDDQVNQRRRQQQTSRVRGKQLDSAKEAAITDGDADAQEFIAEEQGFGEDVFDIRYSESPSGVPQATGSDLALLEQRNRQRSQKARRMDNRRAAEITRDPIEWASDPSEHDFPGIDTIDPQKVHNRRSERAREKDRNELAPKADSLNAWAGDKDHLDWPGVDTPRALGLGTDDADLPDADSVLSELAAGRSQEEQQAKQDALFRTEPMSTDEELTARASAFDVSLDPDRASEDRGFEESDVSFAGPMFNRNEGRVVETDRRDRESAPPTPALTEQSQMIEMDERERDAERAGVLDPRREQRSGAGDSAAGDVMELDDQQTLAGERANDQARLAGGEAGSVDSETESRPMENEGGLLSDQRDDVGGGGDTEQMMPDAFQVAEGGQDTFGDFGGGERR